MSQISHWIGGAALLAIFLCVIAGCAHEQVEPAKPQAVKQSPYRELDATGRYMTAYDRIAQ